jgi:hypothetical protein
MVENSVRVLPQNGSEALVKVESRNRKGPRSRVAKVVISSRVLKHGVRVLGESKWMNVRSS